MACASVDIEFYFKDLALERLSQGFSMGFIDLECEMLTRVNGRAGIWAQSAGSEISLRGEESDRIPEALRLRDESLGLFRLR